MKTKAKKFLCDQMCSDIGRWLRIAGYDTDIIETSMSDLEIFKKAVNEKRILLTRDKYFKELDPKRETIIYLNSKFIEDWVEQLKEEAGVDWLYHPFSRCLQCNSLLKKKFPEDDTNGPKDISDYWICNTCNQIFWLGSHTKRMKNRLIDWQTKNEGNQNR